MLKRYFMYLKPVVTIPYLTVLIASLLVSSGSVRSIFGSWGYWGLWAMITLTGLWSVRHHVLNRLGDKKFLITSSGFFVLGIGLMLAAVVNDDPYTAYQ